MHHRAPSLAPSPIHRHSHTITRTAPDRHEENMLVTHDGVLLHVDYGFILGELGRDMHHYIITFI